MEPIQLSAPLRSDPSSPLIAAACIHISPPPPTLTMAGVGDDLLSALADDLLRRILYFVPFKEAASTSVLSRRWRSLWRSSSAVNLSVHIRHDDYRSSKLTRDQREEAFFSRRDAFVRAAKAALDAADARVTRLTLHVDDPKGGDTYKFLHIDSTGNWSAKHDVVDDLLSHRAARRVEELRIAAVRPGMDAASFPHNEEEHDRFKRTYILRLRSMRCKALRVLDLTRCKGLKPASAADALPRLETLRLRLCSLKSVNVQALMDAAPRLATVHLERVFFSTNRTGAANAPGVCLRCPAVTELVMEFCGMKGQERSRVDRGFFEIDTPRLRYLRYKGSERQFSLASLAPDMAVLELSFLQGPYRCQDRDYDPDRTRALFWQFVQNFTSAKVLKLKVNNLKDIAVDKARRGELLCTFHNAVRLELEGAHHPTSSKAVAVAIANLLRCCPAVRELRLKLSTVPSAKEYTSSFLERKGQLDYEKSLDRFMRRRRLNPVIPLDGDNDKHDEVHDGIPGLSGHSLTCLQSSLSRVGLQFRLDDSSCFGTRLVKFFTDNAMVLEQICVDSGNHKLCEHMNLNAERCIIGRTSSKVGLKRKNLAESSLEFSKIPRKSPNAQTDLTGLATSFTVLPLER
ncbi:unnamed protein product [Urochloa decumbens]|uniref:F-box domain-containing protein n=1 Tax=Urochloa decumbens TaxID=240449 RepID=A0ABC8WG17_9POAL